MNRISVSAGMVEGLLTRNLQMLGAFGYLTCVRGKSYFETYIPAALRTLQRSLNDQTIIQLPKLTTIVKEVAASAEP